MKWEIKLSIALAITSLIFYLLAYFLFHDISFIERYILIQLGFLPISVLLVAIVLESLFERREKKEKREKLNIVIGTFFTDVGHHLLVIISKSDRNIDKIRRFLMISKHWDDGDFEIMQEKIVNYEPNIDIGMINLYAIRKFLTERREFMISLLNNPMLLEHEKFTDLLWGILHFTEELLNRRGFDNLPESDYMHLREDINRIYKILLQEWGIHVKYLKNNYPYIFSLAERTNPFNPRASPILGS